MVSPPASGPRPESAAYPEVADPRGAGAEHRRPAQTAPVRSRPHRTRRAARTPPTYLLDVHVCGGWGRRPQRCLLPSLSPPSPSLPGTSARRDPGSPPSPAPSAPPDSPAQRPAHPSRKQNGGGDSPIPARREPFSTSWRGRCGAENAPLLHQRGTPQGTVESPIFFSF